MYHLSSVQGQNDPLQVFQKALEDGLFRIQQCRECGKYVFPPSRECNHCAETELKWIKPSGKGTVYSIPVSLLEKASDAQHSICTIMLEEGPQLAARVMDVEPEKLFVGLPVSAHIALLEGQVTLVFYNKEQGSQEW